MPRSLPRLTAFEKQQYGYQEHYRVAIHDLGHGHKEATITRYGTLSDWPEYLANLPPANESPDPEENRRRAARRAKTQVRRKCKVLGVDSLWTLTYRECVTDRELVAKHWDAFCRRVRKVLPGFAYVATLERQKRGAWHIHLATHRLPATLQRDGVKVKSWNLLRSIWRSVVGDLGGNFDEQKRKRNSRSRSHKIARYISKYVAKGFEDGDHADGQKRFWVSQGVKVPAAQVLVFAKEQFADLIALVHDAIGGQQGDTCLYLNAERSIFWMSAEAPPLTGAPPGSC